MAEYYIKNNTNEDICFLHRCIKVGEYYKIYDDKLNFYDFDNFYVLYRSFVEDFEKEIIKLVIKNDNGEFVDVDKDKVLDVYNTIKSYYYGNIG